MDIKCQLSTTLVLNVRHCSINKKEMFAWPWSVNIFARICTSVIPHVMSITMDTYASIYTGFILWRRIQTCIILLVRIQLKIQTLGLKFPMLNQYFILSKVLLTIAIYCCVTSYSFVHVDHTLQLNSFERLMRELQTSVTHDNAAVFQYLPHINALLERALSVCRAAKDTDITGTLPLERKENIAPGERKELQWRFQKTTKPPGRKKSGQIFRYG